MQLVAINPTMLPQLQPYMILNTYEYMTLTAARTRQR